MALAVEVAAALRVVVYVAAMMTYPKVFFLSIRGGGNIVSATVMQRMIIMTMAMQSIFLFIWLHGCEDFMLQEMMMAMTMTILWMVMMTMMSMMMMHSKVFVSSRFMLFCGE